MDKTILIAEDDETQRMYLAALISKKLNTKTYNCHNGREAINTLKGKHDKISLILTDLQMPVSDGIEVLNFAKKNYPNIPVIVLTGTQDSDSAVECMKLGATDFVTKPYDNNRVIVTIQNALKIKNMNSEITRLSQTREGCFQFNQIIGHDNGLANIIETARKISATDLPALILGETGTGKELIAKAIHGESENSGEPFITVNCGAIPSELVESTLFGHEKGAFTGATNESLGKFRAADGGTIFLDEIAEMPIEAQTKLLRVLQENEVEPVGSARAYKINVRVVSATHQDLYKNVQKGLFREDLFYRLNILGINIPALKDRKQDIPALLDYFINKIVIKTQMAKKEISKGLLSKLLKYDWPGNVREFENKINRAFVLSYGHIIQESDFDLSPKVSISDKNHDSETNTHNIIPLKQAEKDLIEAALAHCDGNMTKASSMLGVAKSTLYRKIKEIRV
jgi:DNA-binding NtrC family response regulator